MDPLKLAEHVLRESFGVRNASSFLTPEAFQLLQQQKQIEAQGGTGVAGAGGQPGSLAAPGNGQGLDAPQPASAERQQLNAEADDAPVAFRLGDVR